MSAKPKKKTEHSKAVPAKETAAAGPGGPGRSPDGGGTGAAAALSGAAKQTKLFAAGLGQLQKGSRDPAPADILRILSRPRTERSKPVAADKKSGGEPGPGGTNAILPLSPEWTNTIRRLLEDPGYDPREELAKELRYDLVGILAHMPFEFREHACRLYNEGYRVFGKVPYRPDGGTGIGRGMARGEVRPMSCPEPAGEGCQFALAWLDGSAWEFEYGPLDDIDRLVGTGIYAEDRLRGYVAKAKECLAERLRMEIPGDRDNGALAELRGVLADMDAVDDAERLRLATVFRAGATYARQVQCAVSVDWFYDDLLRTNDGWESIIRHALFRHGLDTGRGTLLGKFGCLNAKKFHKTFGSPLLFGWPFTPPVNGVNFDKYFGNALRELKKFAGGGDPNVLARDVEERRKQNEGYKRRTKVTKRAREKKARRAAAKKEQAAAEENKARTTNATKLAVGRGRQQANATKKPGKKFVEIVRKIGT